MTDPSLTLRPATGEALDRVEALLRANDLPFRDVRASPAQFFVAEAGAEPVGVGGIESYGANGLLRSLVVSEPNRGRGYGAALCDALEERARGDGVEALYLLTATAQAFFSRRGYDEIPRESAPPSVRRTTEFAELCPSSAACMEKSLERAPTPD